ncbi:MAG: hypothetical protein EOM36_02515 [Bacteroidia bacterium]|nr:hypothetical protein [Bacteroidia bacterium]
MDWRWDQGRLQYFRFEEIKKIAQSLVNFDGQHLPSGNQHDALRTILNAYLDLPFLPQHYTVWRNYKRVFGCQMLATNISQILVATELCHKLSQDEIMSDDYFKHVATHFYYPSPVFANYHISDFKIFPACAIIKFLISRYIRQNTRNITLEEICGFLIGNNVTGREPLDSYFNLRDSMVRLSGDSLRQLREMVQFFSQFTFLKYADSRLYLDVSSTDEAREIHNLLSPIITEQDADASRQVLILGRNVQTNIDEIIRTSAFLPDERDFLEGRRTRIVHY